MELRAWTVWERDWRPCYWSDTSKFLWQVRDTLYNLPQVQNYSLTHSDAEMIGYLGWTLLRPGSCVRQQKSFQKLQFQSESVISLRYPVISSLGCCFYQMSRKIARDSLITTPSHGRQRLPSATRWEAVAMETQKEANHFSNAAQQRGLNYKLCQESGCAKGWLRLELHPWGGVEL